MVGKEIEYNKIRTYDTFMDKWDEYANRRQELYGHSADQAHELADLVVRLYDMGIFRAFRNSVADYDYLVHLVNGYRNARDVLDNAQQRLDDLNIITQSDGWDDIICAKHPNLCATDKVRGHKKRKGGKHFHIDVKRHIKNE
tara:strand:- start:159 stop:584 length:426 start_codon:yes stop_codon:yes gene_type:complete